MVSITLLKWVWVTLWIILDKVFNSLLSYGGWVTCVMYVVKSKTTRCKNEMWLGTLTLYKRFISFNLHIKNYMGGRLIIYKLMGDSGLPTWMHSYNCIGYTYPFSFTTHKHYV